MWFADYTDIVGQDLATVGQGQVEDFRRSHRTDLVTLLFTDIIGSTELKQKLGDAHAGTLIRQHHSALRAILRQFAEGEEIDAVDDSFFLAFTRPSDAGQIRAPVSGGR